jgi:chemotaxis signal transduction protein
VAGYVTEQIIVFGCRGRFFGLDLDRVEGIAEKGDVTAVPHAPLIAEGIVFYRDGILPVLDLPGLLNISEEGSGRFLLIVRGISEDFCVSPDHIYGIVPGDQLKLKHIPLSERENPYIQGTGDFMGGDIFLLDFTNLEKGLK